MLEEVTKLRLELPKDKHKAGIAHLRFFATLSTGSIVLLTSFLEKIDAQPNLGFLVGIAFAGFMVCILATVIAYTNILQNFGFIVEGLEAIKVGIALSIIWISFTVAMIALTLFDLVNL